MAVYEWIILAAIILLEVAIFVKNFVSFTRLSKEERKKKMIEYLQGIIVSAELMLGDGAGPAKLAYVEQEFKKKAPIVYRMVILFTGSENLRELIEQGLSEIKAGFEKKLQEEPDKEGESEIPLEIVESEIPLEIVEEEKSENNYEEVVENESEI